MLDFSASFHLDRMKSENPLVHMLRDEYSNFVSSPQKADACDRFADSLRQLGRPGEAAMWYEAAGSLICGRTELRPEIRAVFAIEEYERALECHLLEGDIDAEADLIGLLKGLRKECAPA